MAVALSSRAQATIAASILVDDESGRVIRAYRADTPHPPASLAKMMTLYLTFEALQQGRISLGTKVPISYHAASQTPVKLYLRPGQEVTVEQLILAMAVKSANDAAAAMGEMLAGSEAAFAQRMTEKARELGMRSTTFRNASGLPAPGARTTARDMAVLARALRSRFPRYSDYFSRRYFQWGARTYRNTNRLLHAHSEVDGMKTGYTRASGFNLVVTAGYRNHRVILVVLGGRTSRQRFSHAETLLAVASRGLPVKRENVGVVARIDDDGEETEGDTESRVAAAKKDESFALVSRAEASTRLRVRETPRAATAMRYGIQIGAYRNYRQARTAAKRAYYKVPSAYRSGSTRIAVVAVKQGRRTQYAARVLGFNHSAASQACRHLARRGLRCRTMAYAVQLADRAEADDDMDVRSKKPQRSANRRVPAKRRALAAAGTRYILQIGAYKRFSKARAIAKAAHRKFPRVYRQRTKISVVRVKRRGMRLFAARLEGFRVEARAERACNVLERRGYNCDTISYSM